MRIINDGTELVPIDSLTQHPRNPNQGDGGAIHQSIEANGFYGQVIVQRSTGRILAGNHRWLAAKQAGAKEIPATFVDVDDERALRILLADNRTAQLASHDDALIAELLRELHAGAGLAGSGYDGDDLDALLEDLGEGGFGRDEAADEAALERPVDALREKWGTQTGQVWQAGEHRIVCGDATDPAVVGVALDGRPPAAIFTSPPYAVGLDYDSYEDTLPNLRRLLVALAGTWGDRVPGGGYCVVNFGDVVSGRDLAGADEPCEYPMAVEHWPVFRAAGWVLHTRRVWAKPHARVPAPWTASSNRAASDWEHIWTWRKPGGSRATERIANSPLGVWDSSAGAALDVGKDDHPAGFPTIVPRWVIGVYSAHEDVVADPYMGTGTTIVACEQSGRTGVGVEIDPGYVAVCLERLQACGLQPTLVKPKGRKRA